VHTNADVANPGVSDALARELGLEVTGPILPSPPGSAAGAGPAGPGRGLGRFCMLPAAEPLRAFAARVAAALPATSAGIRVAGDPELPVRRVAVCGGAGDDRALLAAVRAAGADAYVTADLRHHPASEAIEAGRFGGSGTGPALVDVAHWAGEWPWLADAAAVLAAGLGQVSRLGETSDSGTVEVRVSELVTDPWTLHAPQN
jgi:putative NIF3 family GTP cyclohydrolase 1 type 2